MKLSKLKEMVRRELQTVQERKARALRGKRAPKKTIEEFNSQSEIYVWLLSLPELKAYQDTLTDGSPDITGVPADVWTMATGWDKAYTELVDGKFTSDEDSMSIMWDDEDGVIDVFGPFVD